MKTTTYLFVFIFLSSANQTIRSQTFEWVKHIEIHKFADASLHLDPLGNIYARGEFSGRVDFDPGPDSSFLDASMLYGASYMLKLDSLGDFVWVKEQHGKIAFDRFGNHYAAGSFTDTLDFDPGPTRLLIAPEGEVDLFIQKFDPQGDLLWVKTLKDAGSLFIEENIMVDNHGEVYVAGVFSDTVDFDPGPNNVNLATTTSLTDYLLKLDAGGDFMWVKKFDEQNDNYISINALAVDSRNKLYLTGAFEGLMDFDPGAGTNILDSGNSSKAFGLKLDSAGNFIWVEQDDKYFSGGRSIKIDEEGNTYISGSFALAFNSGPFIMKLDSMGNILWNHAYATEYGAFPYALESDPLNNVYVGGYFVGLETDFDPGQAYNPLTPSFHPGEGDIYILNLNGEGEFSWAFNLLGKGEEYLYDMKMDDQGFLYVIGEFTDSVDFDPGTRSFVIDTPPRQFVGGDAFILKINTNTRLSARSFEALDIKLYPNPNKGEFQLEIPHNLQASQLFLTDILGNIVLDQRLVESRNKIQIGHLPAGIYMLNLKMNDGQHAISKLILER